MALTLEQAGQLYNAVRADNVFLRRLLLAAKIQANTIRTTNDSNTTAFPTEAYRLKMRGLADNIMRIGEADPQNTTVTLLLQTMVVVFQASLNSVPELSSVTDAQINNATLTILEAMAGVTPADKT